MATWIDANPYLNYYALPSGAMAYHTGADLNLNTPTWDADKGRTVHAIANGIVTHAKQIPTGTWGRLVVIRHVKSDGSIVHSRYGHLASMTVTEGQIVGRGDVVGTVGGAEWGMPNHLHFDISTSGVLENEPTHWPGKDKVAVEDNYENPKLWLMSHRSLAGLDLLPYIRGDGTIYQMKVIWQGEEHSQQMQTQTSYGSAFYLVKNNEWEEFYFDSEYIYRGIDTSPGNGMYYWQRQNSLEMKARWCLRIMAAGQTYERNPLVTFYDKSTGAKLENPASGYRRSWLRLAKHHASWRHPQGAMPFADVVELHWLLKPDAITPAETYFYAKNYGLVGWSSSNGDYSFVVEVFRPGERSPMVRESITIR